MKKEIIYVIVDENGNSVDSRGVAYGYYPKDEKDLCKSYCRMLGLRYKKSVVEVW